jgi:hypothetical protein
VPEHVGEGTHATARLELDRAREHLAGVAADELLETLTRRGWVVRSPGSRAVRLTPSGEEGLGNVLA